MPVSPVQDKSWILILICAIAILFGLSTYLPNDQNNPDNIGFAVNLYQNFSPSINSFASPNIMNFSSTDNIKQISISTSDDAVYKTAWISINGTPWQPITLTGTTLSGNWLQQITTGTYNISRANIPNGTGSDNYLITYSCTKNITGNITIWDCHNNKWQIKIFNTTKIDITNTTIIINNTNSTNTSQNTTGSNNQTNYARTFYVSSSTGNDAYNGTSQSSPWKTIANLNSHTFLPGDGILFKRGDIWREQLTVSSSGSSGNPIVFSSYGTGANPVITGSNIVTGWTSEVVGSYTAYKKIISVKPNIVYQDNTRLAEVMSKTAITPGTFYWDATNTLVYVCTSGNDDASSHIISAGYRDRILDTNNKIYLTFDGITFKNGNAKDQPMRVGSTVVTGIIFRNCTFEQNRGSGINLIGASTATDFIVDNCIIQDNGYFGIVVEHQHNVGIISNNQILSNGWASLQDNTQVSGIQGALGNLDIYGNTIYNSAPGVANNAGMSHGIYVSTPTAAVTNIHNNVIYGNKNGAGIKARYSSNIYRNIIYDNGVNGVEIGGNDAATTQVTYNITYNIIHSSVTGTGSGIVNGLVGTAAHIIYENNVFYKDGSLALEELSIQNNVPFLTIKNNIFYPNDGRRAIDMILQTGVVDIDNNLYWQDTQNGIPNFKYNNAYPTWVQWKALGFDAHGINANPLFVDGANNNFHLQSTSPAINSGANVGLIKDFSGNSIVGLPDIGAYEFTGTITQPPCSSESNVTFCSRLGKKCDSITALDNCNLSRTVSSCGSCLSNQNCTDNICVNSTIAPVCGDGQCNGVETCSSCPGDCGTCPPQTNYTRTFYVSSSTGSDTTGNGSINKPWKTISKVNSQTLQSGDGILFKRGDTWNEALTVGQSGTSTSPITYGAYSTGANPVIDGANSIDRCITLTGRSYITIDGIDCKNARINGIASPSSPGTNIILKNLKISYIGTTDGTQDGIFQQGGYLTVDNCTITQISRCGIMFGGGHNTIINNHVSYTNLYYTTWGAGINGAGDGDVIAYNVIDHCGGVGSFGKTHGIYVDLSNGDVHHNNISNQTRGDGIKSTGSGNFHHNYIIGSSHSGIEAGTNGKTTGGPFTVNIYYNIFTGNRQGISELDEGSVGYTLNIYNNVFYYNNNTMADSYYGEISIEQDVNTALVIKNNILFGYGRYTYAFNAVQSHATINNNVVYQASGNLIYYGGSTRTWASWQGTGFDVQGINANPLFVDSTNSNFHLQSKSLAINSGANVGLTKDYEGNNVPSGSAPDIGAYESG